MSLADIDASRRKLLSERSQARSSTPVANQPIGGGLSAIDAQRRSMLADRSRSAPTTAGVSGASEPGILDTIGNYAGRIKQGFVEGAEQFVRPLEPVPDFEQTGELDYAGRPITTQTPAWKKVAAPVGQAVADFFAPFTKTVGAAIEPITSPVLEPSPQEAEKLIPNARLQVMNLIHAGAGFEGAIQERKWNELEKLIRLASETPEEYERRKQEAAEEIAAFLPPTLGIGSVFRALGRAAARRAATKAAEVRGAATRTAAEEQAALGTLAEREQQMTPTHPAAPRVREARPGEVQGPPAKNTEDVLREKFSKMSDEEKYLAVNKDPLTGVYNRGAYDEIVRTSPPPEQVIFDLDDFKMVNDTHGHEAGDAVLRIFNDFARQNGFDGDLFRYGGDEFTGIRPTGPISKEQLDVIQSRMQNHRIKIVKKDGSTGWIKAGFSYGLGKDFKEADNALYANKTTRFEQSFRRGRPTRRGEPEPGVAGESGGADVGEAGRGNRLDENGNGPAPAVEPPKPTKYSVLSDVERSLLEGKYNRAVAKSKGKKKPTAYTEDQAREIADLGSTLRFEPDRIYNDLRARGVDEPTAMRVVRRNSPDFRPEYAPGTAAITAVGKQLPPGKDVAVTAKGTRVKTRYGIIPLKKLEPSFSPKTGDPNPNYRLGAQGRTDYSPRDVGGVKVQEMVTDFDEARALSDAPELTSGPSAILHDGQVVTGHARAAALKRLLDENPMAYERYKAQAIADAKKFGLDPKRVAAAFDKEPHAIVRVVDEPMDAKRAYQINQESDVSTTAAKSSFELGASKASMLRAESPSITTIENQLASFAEKNPEGTFDQMLNDPVRGAAVMRAMYEEGVFTTNELRELVKPNTMIPEKVGRERIRDVIIARTLNDVELQKRLMETAPEFGNKLAAIVAPIIKAESAGRGFANDLQDAIRSIVDFKNQKSYEDFAGFLEQPDIFAQISDRAKRMARALHDEPYKKLKDTFTREANDAAAGETMKTGLFAEETPTVKTEVNPKEPTAPPKTRLDQLDADDADILARLKNKLRECA